MINKQTKITWIIAFVLILTLGVIEVIHNGNTAVADTKVQQFTIEDYLPKTHKKCGGSLSFVTACGHSSYTSYIFICNKCYKHVEISPKGTSTSPWK